MSPPLDGSGEPPPWSAGDVKCAARGYNWRRVTLDDGTILEGEASWCAALNAADSEQLEALRAAMAEEDLDDEFENEGTRSGDDDDATRAPASEDTGPSWSMTCGGNDADLCAEFLDALACVPERVRRAQAPRCWFWVLPAALAGIGFDLMVRISVIVISWIGAS